MIVYGALDAAGCYAVRWSRVLRPLLLVNVTEGRQVSRLPPSFVEMNLAGYFSSFSLRRGDVTI